MDGEKSSRKINNWVSVDRKFWPKFIPFNVVEWLVLFPMLSQIAAAMFWHSMFKYYTPDWWR